MTENYSYDELTSSEKALVKDAYDVFHADETKKVMSLKSFFLKEWLNTDESAKRKNNLECEGTMGGVGGVSDDDNDENVDSDSEDSSFEDDEIKNDENNEDSSFDDDEIKNEDDIVEEEEEEEVIVIESKINKNNLGSKKKDVFEAVNTSLGLNKKSTSKSNSKPETGKKKHHKGEAVIHEKK
jgi:hypothetical protein